MEDSLLVSLITPVSRLRADWLHELATSVEDLALDLGPSIGVQWILSPDRIDPAWVQAQVSNLSTAAVTVLPSIDWGSNAQARAARTRNRGLAHSQGLYVGTIDDDDFIVAKNYANMVRFAFERDEAWIGGQTEILVDGVRSSYVFEDYVGAQAPGTFRTHLEQHGKQPIVGAAGLWRRDLLKTGWPLLAYHQDTQMWLDLTDKHGGFVLDKTVYVWRRHADQMTPMSVGMKPAVRPRLWK